MNNFTKLLLVMMMCFWIRKVKSCKTPWSDQGRQLYLRTMEELDKTKCELGEYKRREQDGLLLLGESSGLKLEIEAEYLV